MNRRYPLVALRALYRCEYCHAPESVFNFAFEVEHLMPLSLDGSDDEENLALACRSCNLYKGAFLEGIDPETGREETLFNPRVQAWAEHFEVDEETGKIVGSTATGRATVNRLRMNNRAQMTARQQWMRLGVFP